MFRICDDLFALIVIVALPARAFGRMKHDVGPTRNSVYISETAMLSVTLLALIHGQGIQLQAIGFTVEPWREILCKIICCVCAVTGLDIGVLLYTEWASTKTSAVAIASCPHREDGKFLATFVNAIPKRSELIPFIPVCIVGGFWEELCFRGVALSLVPHNAWGMMCGVLGSSVVFAAQHLRRGIAASLYSGGYGILFSLLYLASGNVISVMVAHATGNMFVAAYGAHQAAQIRRKAERVPVLF